MLRDGFRQNYKLIKSLSLLGNWTLWYAHTPHTGLLCTYVFKFFRFVFFRENFVESNDPTRGYRDT